MPEPCADGNELLKEFIAGAAELRLVDTTPAAPAEVFCCPTIQGPNEPLLQQSSPPFVVLATEYLATDTGSLEPYADIPSTGPFAPWHQPAPFVDQTSQFASALEALDINNAPLLSRRSELKQTRQRLDSFQKSRIVHLKEKGEQWRKIAQTVGAPKETVISFYKRRKAAMLAEILKK
ncbi:hypothetical protein HDU91_003694, partial [Kappamyces sp. JEL0680]